MARNRSEKCKVLLPVSQWKKNPFLHLLIRIQANKYNAVSLDVTYERFSPAYHVGADLLLTAIQINPTRKHLSCPVNFLKLQNLLLC